MNHHQRSVSALLSFLFLGSIFILATNMHRTSIACYQELTVEEVANATVLGELCPEACARGNLIFAGGTQAACSTWTMALVNWKPRPFCGCNGSDNMFIGIRQAPYPALAVLVVLVIARELVKLGCVVALVCGKLTHVSDQELDSASILPVLLFSPETLTRHFATAQPDICYRKCHRILTFTWQWLPAVILTALWYNVFGLTIAVTTGAIGCFIELCRLTWTAGFGPQDPIDDGRSRPALDFQQTDSKIELVDCKLEVASELGIPLIEPD